MLFDDKFGSVLICIGKPKVSVGGEEWAWLSPLSLLYFYCNLICELLHVLIINLHQDIPQYLSWLCYLILFYVVRVFIYPKSFVCLFVCLFIPSLFFKACNNTQNLLPAVEITSKHGNKPINSCHIMFIIVYSSFIILNFGFLYLLNFCIYYF